MSAGSRLRQVPALGAWWRLRHGGKVHQAGLVRGGRPHEQLVWARCGREFSPCDMVKVAQPSDDVCGSCLRSGARRAHHV